MSYPPITLYELAITHYADVLREAADYRLTQSATLAGCSRSLRLPRLFDAIAAAFRRQQRVIAAT